MKKKVGIMTFWFGDSNYGQILQCWALYSFLEKKGYFPYIIRYLSLGEGRLKRFIRRFLPSRNKLSPKDKLRDFPGFRKKYLCMSDVYTSLDQIQRNPPHAFAYIAGSDQIWTQSLSNPQIRPYFLDFGSKEIKKIAYAPSFGMQTYPDENKPLLKELLQDFDAVSCREYSGVDICREVGICATKVLDPTLLLTKKDYVEGLNLTLNKREGIFIYSLNICNPEDIRWSELKQIAKDKSWKIQVTPASGYNESSELFDGVEYLYSTPNQWVEQIANSELVVTTSFHGVVFSIIMHTPFVYIPLKGVHSKSNNRVLDLLIDLGLISRILDDNVMIYSVIGEEIDWVTVDAKIFQYKDISSRFLLNGLSNFCNEVY